MNPEPPTLRSLLAFEDGNAVRLLCAPAAPDTVVRRIAVGLDDLSAVQEGDGILLLAVGAVANAETVREAARRGACAVVLGDPGEPGHPCAPGDPGDDADPVAAAQETGIALLARAEGADWAEAAALLRSALSYVRAGVGDHDDADVLRGPEAAPSLAVLAARVAAYVKGSITVEDTRLRVLAHSATGPAADPLRRTVILGGRVPDWRVAELRASGLLRALWTSTDVIHRPADGDSPERLVVAVRSGREVLGSIWAAADGAALAPDAARYLRTAAGLAAPLLVRERLRESGTAQRREAALRGLLHGLGDRRTHAWSLGLSPDAPCAVVVAQRRSAGRADDRSLDVLVLELSAHRPGTGVLRDGDRLVLLVTGEASAADHERAVLALVRELDAVVSSLPDGAAVWLGVGPVLPPERAAESHERAVLVVRALREREARALAAGRPRPARHADAAGVGASLEVLRILDAARPVWESGGGPVHDLIRADLAAGGELVRTLAAYLDAGGDVPEAARRLVVHPNTLRYRLGRVGQRYGVDLADPDARLLLTLAVRLAVRPTAP
ncbi:helix-turn-helix domain-containing protein [Streptomyces sp. NBC_01275]|uniref:PucR family transcriptional regulator n=1 Tax=Streptomyces sp. NBC_01275 TaxID=2903807 RepID=UPI002251E2C8|nr:helix-turn-helix domain-containing protein [Streptomyces sp. NBC_01275]MCX4767128.1 helix-turn-helix domain-containing protein [Streptomyces sp. NBC_01275]